MANSNLDLLFFVAIGVGAVTKSKSFIDMHGV
jgi:hypothetical protein